MATGSERRAAQSGAFGSQLRKRLGALGRFVAGEDTMPALERVGTFQQNMALGLGTMPYDLPNLGRAATDALGLYQDPLAPPPAELGMRDPTEMSSEMAQAIGLDYTPAPAPMSRFERLLAAEQSDDPDWVKRSRDVQRENTAWLERELEPLGISPLGVAGIEMVWPLGAPASRVTRAGEFAQDVAAGRRAAESQKLLTRYRDIARLRAHELGEAPLEAAELKAIKSRVGRLEGRELAPQAPDPVAQAVPGLRPNPPEKAFEYVRMAPKYRGTDPRPAPAVVEIGGKPVFFGQVGDNELTEMAQKYLSDEEIQKSATWYDDARQFVERLAPENRRLGAQLLASWQVAQRNESTPNAWRKLMNVVLEERLGEPVPMVEQAKVKKALGLARRKLKRTPKRDTKARAALESRIDELEGQLHTTRKSGALAHEDMRTILGGGEITDEEIGLKLFDFLDSAYGKTTRSIAGNDPRGGAPAVVDVWMKRIQGVPDGPSLRKLIDRAEAEGDLAAVAKLRAILKATPKEMLERGVPSPHEYEFMAEQLRRLAAKWSEGGVAGKADWKPHEVQAVLWNASLRAHGDDMIFPGTVLGAGDAATVSRASRVKDLSDLREAWVVASNWLSSGLSFDEATGWTATVRSRLAERISDRLTAAIYGRPHVVARKTSREAAREGSSPNLPTVTSATGRWRDDYEPSLLSYHPASTPEELDAYAAGMGLIGRQKAVYTFLGEPEGADGMYFVRIPAARRREVSDALLARGFEGQTVMDDGVALLDPGREKLDAVVAAAKELGLEEPLVVRGRFQRHHDYGSRQEALKSYETVLDAYAAREGRGDLRDVIEAAREESLDAKELAAGAYAQRKARESGDLSGARAGRGAGGLQGGLSQRDLRAKIEAGLERRRSALGRRGADPSRAAAGGVEGRLQAERRPTDPAGEDFRGWFGRSRMTESGRPGDAPKRYYAGSTRDNTSQWFFESPDGSMASNVTTSAVEPAYLRIERPFVINPTRADFEKKLLPILREEGIEFTIGKGRGMGFQIADPDYRRGVEGFRGRIILDDEDPTDVFDLPAVQRALADRGYDGVVTRKTSGGKGVLPLKPDQVRNAITTETWEPGSRLHGERRIGGGGGGGDDRMELTPKDVTRIKRELRRRGWDLNVENVRALGIDDTPDNLHMLGIDPDSNEMTDEVLFLGTDDYDTMVDDLRRGLGDRAGESGEGALTAAQRAERKGWRIVKEERIGGPMAARGRQRALPGIEAPRSAGRPALPGSPGRTAPGALTQDPARVTPIAGPIQTARGAMLDLDPEQMKKLPLGAPSAHSHPGIGSVERALERELAHYSYGSEVVAVPITGKGGEASSALLARPTEAEIETLKGVMLGAGDAWVANPSEIVLGGKPFDPRTVARLARRLASRTGLTFPGFRGKLRVGELKPSVDQLLDSQQTLAGFSSGMRGGTAPLGDDAKVMIEDALGAYRPSQHLLVLARHGLPDADLRFVMAHETGHALMGLRDKDTMAHYLISRIGGAEWREVYREIVRNSRDWARPEAWQTAFSRFSPEAKAQLLDRLDEYASPGWATWTGDGNLEYLGSGQETLADAIARVQLEPEAAKAAMPRFVAALRKIVNEDPQLKKRGVQMAGFGGALLMAEEALRESEEGGGGI